MAHAEPTTPTRGRSAFDAAEVRGDFPILERRVHGRRLVYLDNAATTQKPRAVLDAIQRHYGTHCSNVHRGVHTLSQEATVAYEGARETMGAYVGAGAPREIVFTRGTTEGINLVASTFGRRRVGAGDEILLTGMEHHSNIVPWQMLAGEVGARLVVVPVEDDGSIAVDAFRDRLGERTRMVAVTHVSNALGTVNPVGDLIALAHARGVPVLVDGAQAVGHQRVDVRDLDVDFYAFSGHKMYGPTGIGVLYGKAEHLETMPPWQGGGDMIRSVTFEATTFNEIPHKFEAGTPNIAGAIGLGAAADYLTAIGLGRVEAYERDLLAYATERVSAVPGVRLWGTARHKAAVVSFTLDGVHPHDVGTVLDSDGIAIRAGHHCAQPVMDRFGIPATARASLAIYNSRADVDALVEGLHRVREMFAR